MKNDLDKQLMEEATEELGLTPKKETMTDKSLQDKAIRIQGKQYVLVNDRVTYFNEMYPNGYIQTHLISDVSDEMVVIKAKVTPNNEDEARYFTGYSQATWGQGNVNKTAALENAETSAVGRALAFMGIGVIDSVASADEMHKANVPEKRVFKNESLNDFVNEPPSPKNDVMERHMSEGQKCPNCKKANMVKNPKTGKWFCENKCWLN